MLCLLLMQAECVTHTHTHAHTHAHTHTEALVLAMKRTVYPQGKGPCPHQGAPLTLGTPLLSNYPGPSALISLLLPLSSSLVSASPLP